jgi:hypothetical protein
MLHSFGNGVRAALVADKQVRIMDRFSNLKKVACSLKFYRTDLLAEATMLVVVPDKHSFIPEKAVTQLPKPRNANADTRPVEEHPSRRFSGPIHSQPLLVYFFHRQIERGQVAFSKRAGKRLKVASPDVHIDIDWLASPNLRITQIFLLGKKGEDCFSLRRANALSPVGMHIKRSSTERPNSG